MVLSACALPTGEKNNYGDGNGRLTISTTYPFGDKTVYVDGEYVGKLTKWGGLGSCDREPNEGTLAVVRPAGTHTITATSNDGAGWKDEVTITSGECTAHALEMPSSGGIPVTPGTGGGAIARWTIQSVMAHGNSTKTACIRFQWDGVTQDAQSTVFNGQWTAETKFTGNFSNQTDHTWRATDCASMNHGSQGTISKGVIAPPLPPNANFGNWP
jgi:hypothetical protein